MTQANENQENRKRLGALAVGELWDSRFTITSILGQGSTSVVYKAVDNTSDQTVALKVLHWHLNNDDALTNRLKAEATAAEILKHANIAKIFEHRTSEDGRVYLVEEYVDGETLAQIFSKNICLSEAFTAAVAMQICAALNAAHQVGITHRDIKPSNIIISHDAGKDALVKVVDFGCAKLAPTLGDTVLRLTQTGDMLGSLLYMSPEQCLEGLVDERSDIYSLDCVMYEAVIGKPALVGRTAFETMNAHLMTVPDKFVHVRPDLSLNKEFERIILKTLEKKPKDRYQNFPALIDDLSSIAAHSTSAETAYRPQLAEASGDLNRKRLDTTFLETMSIDDRIGAIQNRIVSVATDQIKPERTAYKPIETKTADLLSNLKIFALTWSVTYVLTLALAGFTASLIHTVMASALLVGFVIVSIFYPVRTLDMKLLAYQVGIVYANSLILYAYFKVGEEALHRLVPITMTNGMSSFEQYEIILVFTIILWVSAFVWGYSSIYFSSKILQQHRETAARRGFFAGTAIWLLIEFFFVTSCYFNSLSAVLSSIKICIGPLICILGQYMAWQKIKASSNNKKSALKPLERQVALKTPKLDSSKNGAYGSAVRAQVLQVITRRALVDEAWKENCSSAMQLNNIAPEEIEIEINKLST